MDDGKYFVRVFGFQQRDIATIEREELNINERFGIDDYSIAITDFPDPFITCTFLTESRLFVNFFYTYSQIHCHFIWEFEKNEIIGQKAYKDLPVMQQMECNKKNFPLKCFYNEERNEIYSFYRQGQELKLKPDDLEDYQFTQVYDGDFG
jgi:hypothetical protein